MSPNHRQEQAIEQHGLLENLSYFGGRDSFEKNKGFKQKMCKR